MPPSERPEDTAAALEFVRDLKLISRIACDFERVGLVGEPSNALVAYFACVARGGIEPPTREFSVG
ncbi:MAG: hypothetical protein ACREUT_06080 [Steroidobacteraceae bacterium]